MNLLILNAGSSTLKFSVFDAADLTERANGMAEYQGHGQVKMALNLAGQAPINTTNSGDDLREAFPALIKLLEPLAPLSTIAAVGHRVVHGGAALQHSVAIDDQVHQTLRNLCALAPLHNPFALNIIEAAQAALPARPQVAVFDTAFFRTLTPEAYLYPLPWTWHQQWGIRRFGFHGISHQYCTGRAAQLLNRRDLKLVICHLGNGCSASAVKDGQAIDTTMGFTPMEGLMMGTRSGSVDPGILLHLLHHKLLTLEHLDEALNRQSGLLGLSEISGDFRQVQHAAQDGNKQARLALSIYARRIRSAIAGLAATLGGIDALVFTGGVGENSALLRSEVCQGLNCLGLILEENLNQQCRPDSDIAATSSPSRILVVHTREDWLIAKETQGFLH